MVEIKEKSSAPRGLIQTLGIALALSIVVLSTIQYCWSSRSSLDTYRSSVLQDAPAETGRKEGPAASPPQGRSVLTREGTARRIAEDAPGGETQWRELRIHAYRAGSGGNVAGAKVSFTPLLYAPDQDLLDRESSFIVKGDKDANVIEVLTDRQGIAKIKVLSQNLYLVHASAPDLMSLGFPRTLRVGTKDVLIPFSKSLTVNGQVLDADGRPLPDASITFCSARIKPGLGPDVFSSGFVTSDSKGKFALSVSKGLHGPAFISVHHAEYVPLVQKLADGKAYSYLVLKLERGIQFRFRLLDSRGNPWTKGNIDLTQGRFRSILKTRPGGVLPDGESKGLKTIVNLRFSDAGVAKVRGWPRDVLAWFTIGATGITRPEITLGFEHKIAAPWGRPLEGNFEFMPRDGGEYVVTISRGGTSRLVIEGNARGFSEADRKQIQCYFEFTKVYKFGIKMAWQNGSFRAFRDFDTKRLEKTRLKYPSFHINFVIPGQEDQRFGPFLTGRDFLIRSVRMIKR